MMQFDKEFALQNRCFVQSEEDSKLIICLDESNDDPFLADDLRNEYQKEIEIQRIEPNEFMEKLANLFDLSLLELAGQHSEQDSFELVRQSDQQFSRFVDDSNVIESVNLWISQAIYQKASDLHFECYEKEGRLRFRLDGRLQEITTISIDKFPAILSRIKIMANLDIGEKRRPQDGRIKVSNGLRDVDIRVSILPTEFGEKAVLRLLDKTAVKLDLAQVGFSTEQEKEFIRAISRPHGMVLVTGPTGSGKTTTLYSALSYLNKADVNILTIEDPIEYNLDHINQAHVKSDIGFTFAAALRSFLRQDPNIIMVGEIRDQETADIAIRASLTGHMVLSTLHTNDSASTVARLLDMGIEPYLLASSLRLVMAQRLVRRICEHCRQEMKQTDDLRESMSRIGLDHSDTIYHGTGCKKCFQTGYKGRIAIMELMPISDDLASLITQSGSMQKIQEQAVKDGMLPLIEAAKQHLLAGTSSLEEVLREIVV